jgi:hypothetical protein
MPHKLIPFPVEIVLAICPYAHNGVAMAALHIEVNPLGIAGVVGFGFVLTAKKSSQKAHVAPLMLNRLKMKIKCGVFLLARQT